MKPSFEEYAKATEVGVRGGRERGRGCLVSGTEGGH